MKLIILVCLLSPTFLLSQTFGEQLQKSSRISDLLNLRDPFKSPIKKISTKKQRDAEKLLRDGVYTNTVDIKKVDLNKMEIIGVLIGKERRAVAKVSGMGGNFILKEGMKVGPNQVELKAILPGGVIFAEKLSNLYGEEEYLETVIPINE